MVRFVVELLIPLALLLLAAGTLDYREAWAWIGVYSVGGTLVLLYLSVNDRELLERRLRKNEIDPRQRLIRKVWIVFTLPFFIVPGLDQRFGWSHVPVVAVVVANVAFLLAQAWVVLVFKTNSFASRVIEVDTSQRVIRSGPYAVVRHPMYLGMLVFYVSTPLALGSWWAVMTVPPPVGILVARALSEERLLLEELEGYREYTQISRHRLIPGVW
jgi:protein-S-isoprenylcysteine O-methyltransferase Ste14